MKSISLEKGFRRPRSLLSILIILILTVSCASTRKRFVVNTLNDEAKSGVCFTGAGQMFFEMGGSNYRTRYESKLKTREKVWDLALFPKGTTEERMQISWLSDVGEVKGALIRRLSLDVRRSDDREKIKQSKIFLGYVGDMIRLYTDIRDEVSEILCETSVDEITMVLVEKCKNAVTSSVLEKTVTKTGTVWVFRPDNVHYVEMMGSAPVAGLYSKFSFIFNGVELKKEAPQKWRVNVDVSECYQRN